MASQRTIYLPPQFSLNRRVSQSWIRQLLRPSFSGQASVRSLNGKKRSGELLTEPDGRTTIVLPSRLQTPRETADAVLVVPTARAASSEAESRQHGSAVRWLRPKARSWPIQDPTRWAERCEKVLNSWQGQFTFRQEIPNDPNSSGLRPPQIGAAYAALAHWTISGDPATVVMPTGTGKTETMLALLVSERFRRLLVVVPTSALRGQIADKFVNLGLLKALNVLGAHALYPVVGLLANRPRTPDDARAFFSCCNVVVTTMSVAGGCSPEVQEAIVESCSHLFIDEAHHITAPTWEQFRRRFDGRPTLQFTATPFRSDGRHVDGKAIYSYPLRKAQAEGYFRTITFRPVDEFDQELADKAIAAAAVAQLERDRAQGLTHIVMARTATIERAKAIHGLYQTIAAAHNPVLVHSRLSATERRDALRRLRQSEAGVVVCVDMLGEGFDLPELKIAALHDVHKSLAITLQFTGRFTRSRSDIGSATMIANIGSASVQDSLRALYAEDADWNVVLQQLNEGAVGKQAEAAQFFGAFAAPSRDIPIQNVLPKMSTVVYRTKCPVWHPEAIPEEVGDGYVYSSPQVNQRDRVAVFVVRTLVPIAWGAIRDFQDLRWDLYLLHWDQARHLLFIHCSTNEGVFRELAEAVAGPDAALIHGETVYRAMHDITRLIFLNLGLSHAVNRMVRFTMYAGPDVYEGLTEAAYQNRIKTNVFGRGYRGGHRVSIGASQRGRIWSHQAARSIPEWVDWCHGVGAKLLDESISFGQILKGAMVPKILSARPDLVPLAIEWPDDLFLRPEDSLQLDIGGDRVPFFEVGLELVDHTPDQPIRFRVFGEHWNAEYEIVFKQDEVEYRPVGALDPQLISFRTKRSLSQWFEDYPPTVYFEKSALLIGKLLYRQENASLVPFDPARVITWDWTGVDITKESQKSTKRPDSIQRRVIETLARRQDQPYALLFDDDASGEAADIVAMRTTDTELIVELYHCKFSKKKDAGARLIDLYEVCGQAQRSVRWKEDPERLIGHLARRDQYRVKGGGASRFERGDTNLLRALRDQTRRLSPRFTVFVVQPGLSRGQLDSDHLELLAATELFLKETLAVNFQVIASP